jgi:tetratricopeptide (TPR) repeat protein
MRAKKSAAAGSVRSDAFDYSDDRLQQLWERLHRGDREPWPEAKTLRRACAHSEPAAAWLENGGGGAESAVRKLRKAWGEFHAGRFAAAIKAGSELAGFGAAVANKAAAIDALYSSRPAAQRLKSLEAAVERGEHAVKILPAAVNVHYTLALVLGRYSQGISIIKAVAAGLAGRVRTHLERTLELEPHHAEGHVAFGLYHAELIGKLGTMAASLTYGASKERALEHFKQALKLAPASPIVRIEYANGLMLLDASRNRAAAQTLYAEAAALEPLDAMEQLDVERARRGLE